MQVIAKRSLLFTHVDGKTIRKFTVLKSPDVQQVPDWIGKTPMFEHAEASGAIQEVTVKSAKAQEPMDEKADDKDSKEKAAKSTKDNNKDSKEKK